MSPVFTLARNNIGPSVRTFAVEMKLGLREATKQTARSITRRVVDLTPPASAGSTGQDARRMGEGKIAAQMRNILAPKRLKGRRKITVVFGRKLRRPVYVTTTEKYPDVAAIYRANSHASGTGARITTSSGRKFYVDTRKFQAVFEAKRGQVGTLAAGWAAGANALDVPLQQWISRHPTSGGRVTIDVAGSRMLVVVENLGSGLPTHLRGELARRIPYAVEYQRAAMERAIEGYKDRTRQKLGIKSA
jgi:hypothetical protein